MLPPAVLPHLFPMIGNQQEIGILPETGLLQRVDHLPHHAVCETNGGVIEDVNGTFFERV